MLDAIETSIKVSAEQEKLETLVKGLYGLKKVFNKVSLIVFCMVDI